MLNWLKGKKREPVAAEPTRDDIVPRMKVGAFLETLKSMGVPQEQLPVTEPFLGELMIAYSFDMPHSFIMVSENDLPRLGIAKSELRAIAVDNLRKQMPQIGIGDLEQTPLKRVVTGNNLEACALLADSWWTNQVANFPGEMLVAAPHRDLVFVGSSQTPNAVQTLKELSQAIIEEGDNHSLSAQIMVWRKDHWEIYQG